jgi:hypothetical protein
MTSNDLVIAQCMFRYVSILPGVKDAIGRSLEEPTAADWHRVLQASSLYDTLAKREFKFFEK